MYKKLLGCAALASLALCSATAIAAPPDSVTLSTPTDQSSWDVPGWLVVDGIDSLSQEEMNSLGAEFNLTFKHSALADETRIELAEVAPDQVASLMTRLYEDSRIQNVEPLSYVQAYFTPNDPLLEKQWHMDRIGMPSAWNFSTGRGVVVAVIDTGVACEDFGPYRKGTDLNTTTCVAGWNFVDKNEHAYDDQGHGSHVAGTIAQSTNNGIGAAGVAFNASLMPVKVLNGSGQGTTVDVADGIRWAGEHGADVINLSLGGPRDSKVTRDAVRSARANGAVVIAAAGNSGPSDGTVGYPGGTEGVIGVSATGQDDVIAKFSSRGEGVDIAAPGVAVTQQTICDGGKGGCEQYATFNGTSMASPHVAGVAALLVSQGVTDIDAIETALRSSARVVDTSSEAKRLYGSGILDAKNATQSVFLKQTLWRLGLIVALLLWLRRKSNFNSFNLATLGAALFVGVGPLAFLPFVFHAPNTAVEVFTRPMGDWSIFLGTNVHQWLPFASVLVPFILTMIFFHVKPARPVVAGVAVGTAAYLVAVPILGMVAAPLGASLLTLWCILNAVLCMKLAKTNVTPGKKVAVPNEPAPPAT